MEREHRVFEMSVSLINRLRRLTWDFAQQEVVIAYFMAGHPPNCLLVGHGSGRAADPLRSPHEGADHITQATLTRTWL